MNRSLLLAAIGCLFSLPAGLDAQVPQLINYQGRVAVGTVNFNGTGQFKFALVDAAGTTTYWSNDGMSNAGSQPTAAVSLPVTKGLYSVLLGDATLAGMTGIPASVFNNSDVRLRVWFNDGVNGSQLLTPDQRIAAVGYAMMAGNVQDGAITSAKIVAGAVGSTQLASNAVQAANIADGTVSGTKLAGGAAAANLNAGGQSGVASGGTILSTDPNNANLAAAGYVRLGKVDLGDAWEQRASGAPPAQRYIHTAVWTGSEMIVWGGFNGSPYVLASLNDGARYNPTSDSWSATATTGAPTARNDHTAVWTGSEMIVWGGRSGGSYLNDGGRYNPTSNTWTATTTTGAPAARNDHTAVWTGSEMIVWGGFFFTGFTGINFNNGGRYNPASDTWTVVTTTGAPAERAIHTAVWTGSEMIVWGGYNFGSVSAFSDGGRYNPAGNGGAGSWAAIPNTLLNTPAPRQLHTAVWTGSEMIVWGGVFFDGIDDQYFNDGGRYNPTSNAWMATATTGAPGPRQLHTAVWTGSEMVVWGGWNGSNRLNDGGRYNLTTNSWTTTAPAGAPGVRYSHTAVWTGSEMIVWGGLGTSSTLNDGGRYNPALNTWKATADIGAPTARAYHTAVWTGSEMIVWGGFGGGVLLNDGGCYNPASNAWIATTATGAPAARFTHTAVWTGSEMIVWGGYAGSYLNNGGRYNPISNTWTATTTSGAPAARQLHTAVWTGSEMIVFGGHGAGAGNYLNDGGRYNPAGDSWTAVSTTGAPAARQQHSAVWTGSEMVVWGGAGASAFLNDGGRYSPAGNTWTAVTTTGAPSARGSHTAVWTGSEMIVWGGFVWTEFAAVDFNDGGRYNPASNAWTATVTTGAPAARTNHTAVWTGSEMIVWGGYADASASQFGDGGRYNPTTNTWTANATTGALAGRTNHTAVWTGSEMIVWGGYAAAYLDTTFSYMPQRTMSLYQRP